MSTVEVFTLIGSVASIVLAGVSIWLARVSVSETRETATKTSETLTDIRERSAATEQIVGEHFENLMDTVLSIVNTATTNPEIRKAEIEAKEREREAEIQQRLFEMFGEAIQSGNQEQLDNFMEVMTKMSDLSDQQPGQ